MFNLQGGNGASCRPYGGYTAHAYNKNPRNELLMRLKKIMGGFIIDFCGSSIIDNLSCVGCIVMYHFHFYAPQFKPSEEPDHHADIPSKSPK